ncbi:MAG: adenylosuccinate lyase [Proteobacteria bacterium]|nr:adenylosuccinate lyase [Pseudomonadota bacterium]
MDPADLLALSPLDGRYASRTAPLRPYLSESALIRYRTRVEIQWLRHLAAEPAIDGLAPLEDRVDAALQRILEDFDGSDAQRVKSIEAEINHDVKAVEYFLRGKLAEIPGTSPDLSAYLHFACTSEDINNLAYGLMLRDARKAVLLPRFHALTDRLRTMAHELADVPMLSRTHGQPASPTTMGKEMANYAHRLSSQVAEFSQARILGKLNGAVGNFNAHLAAYPEAPWPQISNRFVESLGLESNPYTTQIEPHDWIAGYCHALLRIDTVMLDLCRDIWGYVSLGYFRQRAAAGEVGSSTMPHKVNPIDFENAEGNLGVASALLGFLAEKLPRSRWQRDLTDSTTLRNLSAPLGHSLLAVESCLRGLDKLEADRDRLQQDLVANPEVLAEAVQTVMRRYGIADAYEQLKALTRGQSIELDGLEEFIAGLDIPEDARARLAALSPTDYVGLAARLASEI